MDFPEGKNLVGAFHQPACVLIDPDTLSTLPAHFLADGMGEVIKYGCIKDEKLFKLLEEIGGDTARLFGHIDDIIYTCVDIKRRVVERDEKESGERKLLNFGHTYGHALEKINNFEMSHGAAVAVGMEYITRISESRGQTRPGCAERIAEVCREYGLNERPSEDIDGIVAAVKNDKKSGRGGLDVVLLKDIGSAYTFRTTADYFRS